MQCCTRLVEHVISTRNISLRVLEIFPNHEVLVVGRRNESELQRSERPGERDSSSWRGRSESVMRLRCGCVTPETCDPLRLAQRALRLTVSGGYGQVGRRRLIKRTQAGVERAQAQGKWLGAVPKGFARDDDGYLQPVLDPDRESGEVGYLEVRTALTRVTAGESYRAVANDVPNLSRTSLSRIHKNSERREWYLDAAAGDERVDTALDDVSGARS